DVPAALSNRIALEPLAHLIEEHDRDRLSVISAVRKSYNDGAHCSDCHQQTFVKRLTVFDPFKRLDQYVISDDQIRQQIENEPRRSLGRNKMKHDHKQ